MVSPPRLISRSSWAVASTTFWRPSFVRIRFDLEFELSLDDCEYTLNDARFPVDGSPRLERLVGATVLVADADGSGDLALAFDSGDRLVAHDSNAPQYESYTLTGPNEFWLVV